MSFKNARKTKTRTRTIEHLEDRRVMSADPVAQLLGGSVQQHFVDESPALVQHELSGPDFWIDPTTERELNALAGDVDQMIANADSLTGLSYVRNTYGLIGTGQTVAVIDSGIAWDHIALGGGLGSSYRVVGGWDFTENDADPYDDGLYGSHGTHVTGIVGGDRPGTVDDGVAPGVDFVGLRVFDDSGAGYFSWVESALQWVHQNRNAFENPITTVNLSLGTSWNSTTVPNWTTLEDEFAQLKADGIFIAVSAGNSFTSYNSPGLSYPAASPNVVPVMSVDDSGSLSYFSQRQSRAIAAPGRNIVSSIPDYAGNHNGIADDYASMSGTSMAAPYIAGASVLIREAMQSVGYTNITQDTIYNHMMATATSFFDAATNQSYKRINLANAIDSLMGDDYGSTVATAHNLGQLDGASQIHGRIGQTNDSDYFRFTAAANGTVSFTVTAHGQLAPVWNASGGTISGLNGATYTFNVAAGQSYTIGLTTSSGVGLYDLAINANYPFSFTDWGTVTQRQTNNLSNSGATWYRVRASQSGYLTAEVFFNAGGGNIDISLYNSNRQWLASGTPNSWGERADLWVNAGSDYYVCVTGMNADVDLRVTNVLSTWGSAVYVGGTAAADSFSYTMDAKQHTLSINGTTYQFAKKAVTSISFYGGNGADSITMTGSKKKETAVLQGGYASLSGVGITATATGIEAITLNGGGGKDAIALYDLAGNDLLEAYCGAVAMSGTGYYNVAYGFANVTASASSGNDTAHIYDSARNDKYRAYVDHVEMKAAGYLTTAWGFDTTYGHATSGIDKAYLYDSGGNDTYNAYVGYAVMSGAGYSNTAAGFDKTYAYASYGTDIAHLYDSAGDDVFKSYSNRAIMSGYGYINTAYGFDAAVGHSSTGNDVARQYGSRGNDLYVAGVDQTQMSGAGFNNTAVGFDRNIAYGRGGVDRAWVNDLPSIGAEWPCLGRVFVNGYNQRHAWL